MRLQLLELPAGTVLFSESRVATLSELSDLQDTLAAHIGRAADDHGSGFARLERRTLRIRAARTRIMQELWNSHSRTLEGDECGASPGDECSLGWGC